GGTCLHPTIPYPNLVTRRRCPMSARPLVAVVSNSLTPYRLHLHRRIARELPEIELASLFTHVDSTSPWGLEPPADIHPVQFGAGEPSANQVRARYPLHERRPRGTG